MLIEQAGYPYVEGSRGIEFKGVRTVAAIDQDLKTGSGRRVVGRLTPTSLQIWDLDTTYPVMKASLIEKALEFDIYTRHPGQEPLHPDFFAGKFVAFALHNLGAAAGKIDAISAIWQRSSLNFRMFMNAETTDIVEAARMTWTGRIAQANGYDVLTKEYIEIDDRNEDTVIRVLFKRKVPQLVAI